MDGPYFTRHRGGTPSSKEDNWLGADSHSRHSAHPSEHGGSAAGSTSGGGSSHQPPPRPPSAQSPPPQPSPSPHQLFKHSRELLGGLAVQGRVRAAKSNRQLASLQSTFRDENPRLYGCLFDVCDAIAYVGWEMPFGYTRDEWLSCAFVCLVAAIVLLVPALVGLGLGSKAQLQDVAWAANGAYSNGIWMTPAG
jgi:hypothetical protein